MENYKSGFVSIVGAPSVGKSTLINQILHEKRMITSSKPQTTRNIIRAIFEDEQSQIVFLDTPGIHEAKHKLGENLNTFSKKSVAGVDIVIFMISPYEKLSEVELELLKHLRRKKEIVTLLAVNKTDLVSKEEVEIIKHKYTSQFEFVETIELSASQGENVTELVNLIKKYLPYGPKYYEDSDYMDKEEEMFTVSELIRERIIENTKKELPHSVAVDIVEMHYDSKKDMVFVDAEIIVERQTQKGIILGKDGSMIKKIGMESRVQIEDFMGRRVNLKTFVKVEKNWRNNQTKLNEYGYNATKL